MPQETVQLVRAGKRVDQTQITELCQTLLYRHEQQTNDLKSIKKLCTSMAVKVKYLQEKNNVLATKYNELANNSGNNNVPRKLLECERKLLLKRLKRLSRTDAKLKEIAKITNAHVDANGELLFFTEDWTAHQYSCVYYFLVFNMLNKRETVTSKIAFEWAKIDALEILNFKVIETKNEEIDTKSEE
jgi:hypothetical protein